jgi:RNA polymerase sigma-70 factor (ECF subfamily)
MNADAERMAAHADRLRRQALRLCRSPHDADDLVQETFARVLARPRRLQHGDVLPYLLRSLRNTYLTGLRAERRLPHTVELPGDEHPALAVPDAAPDLVADRRAVFAAIAALPLEARRALVAVDVVGLSYREAARVLQTRETTITNRLHRARRRVRAALTQPPASASRARTTFVVRAA